MGDKVGIIMLAELDPSGRAGSDHRESSAFLNAVDELCAFLHDSKVGAEVGVKYLVEAEHMEGCSHFAGDVCADRHTETFAEGSSDRRSCMYYNVLCRICKSLEYLSGIVALNECACRTNYGTLTAAYAGNVAEVFIERAADRCVKASVVSADNGYILVLTCSYAAAAEDTLVVVSYEVESRIVYLILSLLAGEFFLVNAVLETELLKLAVIVSRAGETFFIVV